MSKHNRFLGFIKSRLNSKVDIEKTPLEDLGIEKNELQNVKIPNKIFNFDYYPLRKLVFWGVDEKNNPSFLILYGYHEFVPNSSGENELKDDVTYTYYAIFRGKEGHFPSFESVQLLDSSGRNNTKKMFYKKDTRNHYYWYDRSDKAPIRDFYNFKEDEKISFPYFKIQSYEDNVAKLLSKRINFNNFILMKSPLDVMNLSEDFSKYHHHIYEIFSNFNIYMRKKYLKELINSHPPKELYDFLFNVGSSELISGLFLELSLQKNPDFIEIAKDIIERDVRWVDENYSTGVKRCASIYYNSFDEKAKQEKVDFIKSTLKDMDLHVYTIQGKRIPEDKIIEGATYRKYADCGYLAEYRYEYNYSQRKSIKIIHNDLYKKSYYSNGTSLNINNFKNTIQEAEVFELADVLGKIAYYLDAPRLTYHFKGNRNYKGLLYFRRYLRRIFDSYAKNDEIKFMEAMKSLLTSYTNIDYICKFKGNFQFNYFIKYYLYNNYDSTNYQYYYDGKDKLLNAEGRYDFSPEVWNRHLDYVLDIASVTKIEVISKALHYILTDPSNEEALNTSSTYEKLIALLDCAYNPTTLLSKDLLLKKLESEKTFNIDLMIQLMNCQSEEAHEVAMQYFSTTQGKFSAEGLVSFLLFDDSDKWLSLIESSIQKLDGKEYLMFLNSILDNSNKFKEHNITWSKDLEEVLYNSFYKLTEVSSKEQIDFVSNVLFKLQEDEEISNSILNLMEEIIFSSTFDELKYFLRDKNIELKTSSMRKRLILSLLLSIKDGELLFDSSIIEIIEGGSPAITKTLIDTISTYKPQLDNRYETLLIMFESEIVALNEMAKEVFEALEKDAQRKMHMVILDSPDKKVYSYGLLKLRELYEDKGEFIPEEFISKMFEHPAQEVKSFISDKINEFMENPENSNTDLFIYYSKAILYLPNKISTAKNNIYNILPKFVKKHKEIMPNIEEILLDIGSSNIILDSERALVTLCRIKKEVF